MDEAPTLASSARRKGSELTEGRRRRSFAPYRSEGTAMKWKKPVIIEISVGLEINAYACAEVK
jgi:coenzyme PQQ precursor peptide PqqA